jgi:hypothetical protein
MVAYLGGFYQLAFAAFSKGIQTAYRPEKKVTRRGWNKYYLFIIKVFRRPEAKR